MPYFSENFLFLFCAGPPAVKGSNELQSDSRSLLNDCYYLECAEDAGFSQTGVAVELPEAAPEYVQVPQNLQAKNK